MSKPISLDVKRLNERGLNKLKGIFDGTETFDYAEDSSLLADPNYTDEAPEFNSLKVQNHPSWLELGQNVKKALCITTFEDFVTIQNDEKLWGWLSLALWDAVALNPTKAKAWYKDNYKRESWLFVPAHASDFHKYQRHLIRTPVHLVCEFDKYSHHLLTLDPQYGRGEYFEQLTAKQRYWDERFQQIATQLYYDEKKKKLKKGAPDKTDGGARRLNRIFDQFDVTWEMENMPKGNYIKKLPDEFKRFK
jgi:hypothetical protein